MVRTPDLERRRQLLHALVEEFAAGGVGDRSLREVAGAVGTSHRMLLHHFGSRVDLLVAIVEEVERRQMALLPDLPTTAAEGLREMLVSAAWSPAPGPAAGWATRPGYPAG